jgi:hypothetical protein
MSKITAEALANLLISIYEETGDSIIALHKIIEKCKLFSTK